MSNLETDVLTELQRIRAALEASNERPNERSSFEIDSNSTAGRFKIRARVEAATVDEAREQAHFEFVHEMAALEAAQEAGWQATLEKLIAEGAAA